MSIAVQPKRRRWRSVLIDVTERHVTQDAVLLVMFSVSRHTEHEEKYSA